jgi:hypothetical protein
VSRVHDPDPRLNMHVTNKETRKRVRNEKRDMHLLP